MIVVVVFVVFVAVVGVVVEFGAGICGVTSRVIYIPVLRGAKKLTSASPLNS